MKALVAAQGLVPGTVHTKRFEEFPRNSNQFEFARLVAEIKF